MIAIDVQSRKPIYEQIVERFETLIVSGVLAPDSQLPSVRALAMELSINPNTIQKAYAMLEQEGFIYPVRGRGNFVSGEEEKAGAGLLFLTGAGQAGKDTGDSAGDVYQPGAGILRTRIARRRSHLL